MFIAKYIYIYYLKEKQIIYLLQRANINPSVEDLWYENNNMAKGKQCMTQGGVMFQNKSPTLCSVITNMPSLIYRTFNLKYNCSFLCPYAPEQKSAVTVRLKTCCVILPPQSLSDFITQTKAVMPDYLGTEQRKVKEEEKEDKPIRGIVCEDFRVD